MKKSAKKILVIGAGAWGSALAKLLAKNGNQVVLSANRTEVVEEINRQNSNEKFLPSIKLGSQVSAVVGFEAEMQNFDLVFVVTPSVAAIEIFQKISKQKLQKKCGFVICSKGLEVNSLELLSDAFERIVGNKNYAVLSGPNFAIEVASEVPTITTIATKNKKLASLVTEALNGDYFHAIYSKDPRSAEICGLTKNIIAIACGISDGLALGVNAKAALVVKGVAEIQLLCKRLKASSDIANAAGFGDIFLTCSSAKSRNNSLGVALSSGKTFEEILAQTNKTYEGAASALAVSALAKKLKLQLNLCDAVSEILTKKFSSQQIKEKIVSVILS